MSNKKEKSSMDIIKEGLSLNQGEYDQMYDENEDFHVENSTLLKVGNKKSNPNYD